MSYIKIQQQMLKKWADPCGDYIWGGGKYDGKIAVGTQAYLVFNARSIKPRRLSTLWSLWKEPERVCVKAG